MTHKELLADNQDEQTNCAGEVELYKAHVCYDDVMWDIYLCLTCGAKIATCQAAWWNHTAKTPLFESKE